MGICRGGQSQQFLFGGLGESLILKKNTGKDSISVGILYYIYLRLLPPLRGTLNPLAQIVGVDLSSSTLPTKFHKHPKSFHNQTTLRRRTFMWSGQRSVSIPIKYIVFIVFYRL